MKNLSEIILFIVSYICNRFIYMQQEQQHNNCFIQYCVTLHYIWSYIGLENIYIQQQQVSAIFFFNSLLFFFIWMIHTLPKKYDWFMLLFFVLFYFFEIVLCIYDWFIIKEIFLQDFEGFKLISTWFAKNVVLMIS
jgi:hypothetical protein